MKHEPRGMPNTIKPPSSAPPSGQKKRKLTSNAKKSSKTPLKSVEYYDSVINKVFAEHTKGMNLKY